MPIENHPSGEPWPWGREPRAALAEFCLDFSRLLAMADLVFLWVVHGAVVGDGGGGSVAELRGLAAELVAEGLLLLGCYLLYQAPTLKRAGLYAATVAALLVLPQGPFPGPGDFFTKASLHTFLPEAFILCVAGGLYAAAFLSDAGIFSRPECRPSRPSEDDE